MLLVTKSITKRNNGSSDDKPFCIPLDEWFDATKEITAELPVKTISLYLHTFAPNMLTHKEATVEGFARTMICNSLV